MPVQIAPPTAEQKAWFRAHPNYQRMSHAPMTKFSSRGTLRPDGTFLPESAGRPVMDGNGDFGVGIPVIASKRRR